MSHPSPFRYLFTKRREERAQFWRDAAAEFRKELRHLDLANACEERANDCDQGFEHFTHSPGYEP